ncbi:MAG: alpha-mannosidase [Chloroflexi bacterium]|nr:alpha-mannosidase [Chloroflexota bacterium]
MRAEYLVGGYGQAAYLFAVPETLTRKVEAYHDAMRSFYGDRSLLAMYGTDHAAPVPEMVALVKGVNATASAHEVRIETLAEYLAAAKESDEMDPTLIEGEMRSGARANVLMGVASAHIDLKVAAGRAERTLERYAEPFQALYGDAWPEVPLSLAWRRVVENSAHDSICGCSVDPVTAQVLTRYAEAEQLGQGLTQRALARAAAGAPRDACVAFNPSPHERRGLVELNVPIPESWASVALTTPDGTAFAAQEVSRNRPLLYEASVTGAELLDFLARRLHGRELFGRQLNAVRLDRVDGRHVATLLLDDEADPPSLEVEDLRGQVALAVAAAPAAWTLRAVAQPRRTVRAMVTAPPLGAVELRPREGPAGVDGPVTASAGRLANGLIEVTVGPDGRLAIDVTGGPSLQGVGRLVDGGDFGDSYNYGPPPADTMVAEPLHVRWEVTASGPVAGELLVTRTYRWPLGLVADGSARLAATADVSVRTVVALRAGEPFVRLRVEFDNPAIDHRVRFHIPLPVRADVSAAEGQFAVVERGMHPEAGHGEVPLATYPARGFVDAGGMAVLLDHITEYELLDGQELALTVLRSTGLISRNDNPYREDPAGPERPAPATQMRGPWSIGFALFPHAGSWEEADVVRQAERYAHEFVTARGGGMATGPAAAAGIAVEGRGVVLSALLRRDDWLELRLVAETAQPTRATVRGGFLEARDVDLLGRPGAAGLISDGVVALELGAWEIRTIQLRR